MIQQKKRPDCCSRRAETTLAASVAAAVRHRFDVRDVVFNVISVLFQPQIQCQKVICLRNPLSTSLGTVAVDAEWLLCVCVVVIGGVWWCGAHCFDVWCRRENIEPHCVRSETFYVGYIEKVMRCFWGQMRVEHLR